MSSSQYQVYLVLFDSALSKEKRDEYIAEVKNKGGRVIFTYDIGSVKGIAAELPPDLLKEWNDLLGKDIKSIEKDSEVHIKFSS